MIVPKVDKISFANLETFYQEAYDTALLKNEEQIEHVFANLIKHRDRYHKVQDQTGVPWLWLAAIHNLEGSCNFETYLHNGDPLGKKTVHVPVGVGPFNTWEESAIDVIKTSKLDKVTDWSRPRMLYEAEKFNGLGYIKQGLMSPYVWSCTSHYEKGKYVADGKYDPNAISRQVGIAAILIF